MTHCVEETRRAEQEKAQLPLRQSAVAEETLSRIAENHGANKAAYERFIATLGGLCERANQQQSKPWNFIEVKAEDTTRDKHLYCFSNCECFNKTATSFSFPFVRLEHYKHIRMLWLTVSQEMGKCDISVKDVCLVKTRMKQQESNNAAWQSNKGFLRANRVFPSTISDLDKDTAIKILDWLSFKTELKSLPFCREHYSDGSRLNSGWLAFALKGRNQKAQSTGAAALGL